jgi:predicted nuclease of restriction endonuclease-like (RecB) superfamily
MKKPTRDTAAINPPERKSRGRKQEDASFPVAPSRMGLPDGYAAVLNEIKRRIQTERLRTVMAANSAMIMLYWDIGRLILDRQEREGWGARVIDRLSADLREAYPDMSGLSPRNLKYMRTFAAAWPDPSIVQRVVAQIPWRSNLALLDKLNDPAVRQWYAEKAIEQGWSQPVLCFQIDSNLHARQGKAVSNFAFTLPPADSDMAAPGRYPRGSPGAGFARGAGATEPAAAGRGRRRIRAETYPRRFFPVPFTAQPRIS